VCPINFLPGDFEEDGFGDIDLDNGWDDDWDKDDFDEDELDGLDEDDWDEC